MLPRDESKHYGGIVHRQAGCQHCPWTAYEKNCHGLAAIHARAFGHTTWVEVTSSFSYRYGPDGDPDQLSILDECD